MNFFRFQLLKREFVFLPEYLEFIRESDVDADPADPGLIREIRVQRTDDALLDSKAEIDRYSWSGGGHYHYRLTRAIWLADGRTYLDFIPEVTEGESGETHTEPSLTLGEQLAEGGYTLPDFIVVYEKRDHDDWGRGDITRDITIYKCGKFDLAGYYAQKIDEAAAELKAELALVSL